MRGPVRRRAPQTASGCSLWRQRPWTLSYLVSFAPGLDDEAHQDKKCVNTTGTGTRAGARRRGHLTRRRGHGPRMTEAASGEVGSREANGGFSWSGRLVTALLVSGYELDTGRNITRVHTRSGGLTRYAQPGCQSSGCRSVSTLGHGDLGAPVSTAAAW